MKIHGCDESVVNNFFKSFLKLFLVLKIIEGTMILVAIWINFHEIKILSCRYVLNICKRLFNDFLNNEFYEVLFS